MNTVEISLEYKISRNAWSSSCNWFTSCYIYLRPTIPATPVIYSIPRTNAGDCHCCQCSTSKRLTLIPRVEFSFLKMLWIRFSNLSESSWGRHCGEMLPYARGTFFRIVPFLIQFAIPCNVLTKRISLFWQLARIFSELLYAACSEAMAFRTVGIGQ